jgi:(E)-4-hydroxy-3-methylbut-2-enyl-diphosphate synthase
VKIAIMIRHFSSLHFVRGSLFCFITDIVNFDTKLTFSMQKGLYRENLTHYSRRSTVAVNIGNIPLGSDYPIRVQSMANTLTSDLQGSVAQCIRIIKAGADYIRITVPSLHDVTAVGSIKQELLKHGYQTPVIADVHFNAEIAIQVVNHVDKVRINPGNFTDIKKFLPLLEKCHARGVAMRIGVNHGSLSDRIMSRYGDTPLGMAESAMEFLRICRNQGFDQIVVSMKASNVRVMVQATRLVAAMMMKEGMNFPLHLGVTEAGEGEDGRIKSATGIGALLADGLGDTIRVSLTEEPENEIPVALKLVKHVTAISQHDPLPEMHFPPADLFTYNPRISRTIGNIGGNNPPVVIGSDIIDESLVKMVNATYKKLTDTMFQTLKNDKNAVLVYQCSNANVQAELRWLHFKLQEQKCDVPVIFKLHLYARNPEDFQLKSAAGLGGAFIDGFGNGIWLTNQYHLADDLIISASFGILQACRARITKTEYISCPSCGRTNFNLIETLARIKAATSHLKGLKIGIMGCIVNGPGEMADADYGYVGAGKGMVTLYKSKEVIKRGIPEDRAVEELINLIKENGDWVEVKT